MRLRQTNHVQGGEVRLGDPRLRTLVRAASASLLAGALVLSLTPPASATDDTLVSAPDAVAFDDQVVGTTSEERTATITNIGDDTIEISDDSLEGPNLGDFARRTDCIGELPEDESCTMHVTFTPSALGARSARLEITHDGDLSPLVIPLSGTGISDARPDVALDPTSIAFADQVIGTRSGPGTVTLRNVGTAALTINSVTRAGTNPGQFTLVNNNCAGSLAPQATCTVTVWFAPSSIGLKSARIEFSTNAAGSPHSVELSGRAIADSPDPALSPPVVNPDPFRVGGGRTAIISATVNEAATLRFRIFNAAGRVVRRFPPQLLPSGGTGAVAWNGRNNDGVLVRAGTYTARATAVDLDGNTTVQSTIFTVVR